MCCTVVAVFSLSEEQLVFIFRCILHVRFRCTCCRNCIHCLVGLYQFQRLSINAIIFLLTLYLIFSGYFCMAMKPWTSQSNLGRATSPPLMQRIPLVTMGCSTFTPITAPSPLTVSTPSNTPIHRLTPLTHHPKWYPDPISRFATVHPPDGPADRSTDQQMG